MIFLLKVRPERVIVFHTDWEVSKEKILRRRGVETRFIEIPAYDYQKIEENHRKDIIHPEIAYFLTNVAAKYTVEVIHRWLEANGGTSLYYMPDGTVARFRGEHLFRIESDILEPEDFLNLGGFSMVNQVKFEEKMRDKTWKLMEFYRELIDNGKFCETSQEDEKRITRREKEILGNMYRWLYRNSREGFRAAGHPLEFLTYMVLLESGRFNHIMVNVAIHRMEREPDRLIEEWKRVAFSYV